MSSVPRVMFAPPVVVNRSRRGRSPKRIVRAKAAVARGHIRLAIRDRGIFAFPHGVVGSFIDDGAPRRVAISRSPGRRTIQTHDRSHDRSRDCQRWDDGFHRGSLGGQARNATRRARRANQRALRQRVPDFSGGCGSSRSMTSERVPAPGGIIGPIWPAGFRADRSGRARTRRKE